MLHKNLPEWDVADRQRGLQVASIVAQKAKPPKEEHKANTIRDKQTGEMRPVENQLEGVASQHIRDQKKAKPNPDDTQLVLRLRLNFLCGADPRSHVPNGAR
jgi:hypothetical protein